MRQHLTAVNAACEVGQAKVQGASLGSAVLAFEPTVVEPGAYDFAIGTAGSTTLVLQTVLPALLTASGPSVLTLEGGTHNPYAPPFDFLRQCFLPLINRMGPTVDAMLERPGFYPAGGGKMVVTVEPAPQLVGFELPDRGEIRRRQATATVSNLPREIAERELRVIEQKLGWPRDRLIAREVASRGPGNVVSIEVQSEHVSEVVTGFGQRGVRAETVAERAVEQMRHYLEADAPVGEYLADQLIIPLALAGTGAFRTLEPSRHTATNIAVTQQFLDCAFAVTRCGDGTSRVELAQR